MEKPEVKSKTTLKKLTSVFVVIIILIVSLSIVLGNFKERRLYQRGFRLLQEQIAYYIVENYTGVSKVEFSPIFKDGGPPTSPMTLDVVPKIYDKFGNSALLGGQIGDTFYMVPGYPGSISIMRIHPHTGEEMISLATSNNGEEIDVSDDQHLPRKGKIFIEDDGDDENEIIEWLVDNGKLKDINRNKKGSPEAEIIYNLEIKKGDWTTWR